MHLSNLKSRIISQRIFESWSNGSSSQRIVLITLFFLRLLSLLFLCSLLGADLSKTLHWQELDFLLYEKSVGGDWYAHFYGGLGLQLSLVALLTCVYSYKKSIWYSLGCLFGALILSELSQLELESRTFQLSDLLAGLSGVLLAFIACKLAEKVNSLQGLFIKGI